MRKTLQEILYQPKAWANTIKAFSNQKKGDLINVKVQTYPPLFDIDSQRWVLPMSLPVRAHYRHAMSEGFPQTKNHAPDCRPFSRPVPECRLDMAGDRML